MRHNPNMSSYLQDVPVDQVLNNSDPQNKFKFAFTIEEYWSKVRKDNRKYVKWLARLFKIKDGVWSHLELNMHECTDEDYS